MSEKRALITGITGQDGACLAEFLLDKGYELHGVKRRSSSFNTGRIDHLHQDPHQDGVKFKMHFGDLTDDYVLTTGEQHSVREFVELAFAEIGRLISWDGSGETEAGVDTSTGDILVEVDPQYFRPTEVDSLLGDPTKAKNILGWATKRSFEDFVKEMALADRELIKAESHGR